MEEVKVVNTFSAIIAMLGSWWVPETHRLQTFLQLIHICVY